MEDRKLWYPKPISPLDGFAILPSGPPHRNGAALGASIASIELSESVKVRIAMITTITHLERFLDFAGRPERRAAFGLGCILLLQSLTHVAAHLGARDAVFWFYLALSVVVGVPFPIIAVARLQRLRISAWWVIPLLALWASYAFAVAHRNLAWTLTLLAILVGLQLPLAVLKGKDPSLPSATDTSPSF